MVELLLINAFLESLLGKATSPRALSVFLARTRHRTILIRSIVRHVVIQISSSRSDRRIWISIGLQTERRTPQGGKTGKTTIGS